MVTTRWYINAAGREQGPVSGQQLKELAATGKLKPDMPIRKDGMDQAIPAGRVKGLFADPPAATSSAEPEPQIIKQPSPTLLPPAAGFAAGPQGRDGTGRTPRRRRPGQGGQGTATTRWPGKEGKGRSANVGLIVVLAVLFGGGALAALFHSGKPDITGTWELNADQMVDDCLALRRRGAPEVSDRLIKKLRALGPSAAVLIKPMYDDKSSYSIGDTGLDQVPYTVHQTRGSEIVIQEREPNGKHTIYRFTIKGDVMTNHIDEEEPEDWPGPRGLKRMVFKRVSPTVDKSQSMADPKMEEHAASAFIFLSVLKAVAAGEDTSDYDGLAED